MTQARELKLAFFRRNPALLHRVAANLRDGLHRQLENLCRKHDLTGLLKKMDMDLKGTPVQWFGRSQNRDDQLDRFIHWCRTWDMLDPAPISKIVNSDPDLPEVRLFNMSDNDWNLFVHVVSALFTTANEDTVGEQKNWPGTLSLQEHWNRG